MWVVVDCSCWCRSGDVSIINYLCILTTSDECSLPPPTDWSCSWGSNWQGQVSQLPANWFSSIWHARSIVYNVHYWVFIWDCNAYYTDWHYQDILPSQPTTCLDHLPTSLGAGQAGAVQTSINDNSASPVLVFIRTFINDNYPGGKTVFLVFIQKREESSCGPENGIARNILCRLKII